MKTRLLKRLRRRGRDAVTITKITRTNGDITGIRYYFSGDEYRGLFSFGDTEDEVRDKACRIYMENYVKKQRENEK